MDVFNANRIEKQMIANYDKKEGHSMSKLSAFISQNRNLCYAMAEENTQRNSEGRVVISKNDEWRNEKEWDSHYNRLAGEKVLSVKITKHTPRKEDPYDTPIVYWKEAKLNFESTARISKTYSLNKDAFIFKIGTLDTRDMDKVSDLYIKFVKESMRETSSEEIA